MANAYVDIFRELETRLRTALEDGNRLAYVKTFWLCPREDVKGTEDCPAIVLGFDTPAIEDSAKVIRSDEIMASMNAKLFLYYGIADDYTNSRNDYYDYDNSKGMLFMIEDVLDVLMEDTALARQPTLNNTLHQTFFPVVEEIVKLTNNILSAEITLPMESKYFTINERSS